MTIPTIAEGLLVLIAAAIPIIYQCSDILRWLAARCLTRAHVIEVSKREHAIELAKWNREFGLSKDRAARVRMEGINA